MSVSAPTGSLQAVQCSGQSQAPVPPRLPWASGGRGRRGAGQEEGLIRIETGHSRDFLVMDGGGGRRRRRGRKEHPYHIRHSFILVLALPTNTFTTLNLIMDCIMFMYRQFQSTTSVLSSDGCHESLSLTFFVCGEKKK